MRLGSLTDGAVFQLFLMDEEQLANLQLWKNLLLRTRRYKLWHAEIEGQREEVWGVRLGHRGSSRRVTWAMRAYSAWSVTAHSRFCRLRNVKLFGESPVQLKKQHQGILSDQVSAEPDILPPRFDRVDAFITQYPVESLR